MSLKTLHGKVLWNIWKGKGTLEEKRRKLIGVPSLSSFINFSLEVGLIFICWAQQGNKKYAQPHPLPPHLASDAAPEGTVYRVSGGAVVLLKGKGVGWGWVAANDARKILPEQQALTSPQEDWPKWLQHVSRPSSLASELVLCETWTYSVDITEAGCHLQWKLDEKQNHTWYTEKYAKKITCWCMAFYFHWRSFFFFLHFFS